MGEPVIIEGVRTPFAKSGGVFKDLPASELGRIAVGALLEKTGIDPAEVDELIVGSVAQSVDMANVARVIAGLAGLPERVPAHTVNRNCASGMEAVSSAIEHIRTHQSKVIIAGGVESMSTIPVFQYSRRLTEAIVQVSKSKSLGQKISALAGLRPRDFKPAVVSQTDPLVDMRMGDTAELLAKEYAVSREAQDRFAFTSHERAVHARPTLREEITPVYLPPDYSQVVQDDVGPRPDQTLSALSKLPPYFDRRHGTVTAGNASPITDGAAMLLVMEEEKARSLGLHPIGRVRSYAYVGLDPARMGLGPSFATPLALKRAGVELKQMRLIEINEAFAAQVLANEAVFKSKGIGEIDFERLNVNGGAIALGHPLGASGARLLLTLLYELRRRRQEIGLATLCVGGGQGAAFVV